MRFPVWSAMGYPPGLTCKLPSWSAYKIEYLCQLVSATIIFLTFTLETRLESVIMVKWAKLCLHCFYEV